MLSDKIDQSESFSAQVALIHSHSTYVFFSITIHTPALSNHRLFWVHYLAQGPFAMKTEVPGMEPLTFWLESYSRLSVCSIYHHGERLHVYVESIKHIKPLICLGALPTDCHHTVHLASCHIGSSLRPLGGWWSRRLVLMTNSTNCPRLPSVHLDLQNSA